jgi:hypothetical protein
MRYNRLCGDFAFTSTDVKYICYFMYTDMLGI